MGQECERRHSLIEKSKETQAHALKQIIRPLLSVPFLHNSIR